MSRELKLRGQCKANNEWVYGSLDWERDEEGYKRWYIHTGADGGFEEHYRVIPETVGQYTGLKDKNGKDIYEGDVVVGNDKGNEKKKRCGMAVVTFYKNCYKLRCKCGVIYQRCIWETLEVIGNIHDNPTLLER